MPRLASIPLVFASGVFILDTGPVSAHAFGQRYDLPLPLDFYLVGAGLAVALSFIGSFLFTRRSSQSQVVEFRVPHRLAVVVSALVRVFAVLLLALVLFAAIIGPATPTANLATVFIWIIWWIGVTLFTALVVDLWSIANPFTTLVDFACRQQRKSWVGAASVEPAGWLAVAGLVAIAWLELVSDWSENPRAMAIVVALYCVGLFLGSLAYGRRRWFAAADPLSRLFHFLGRMAPIDLCAGTIRLRLPATGLIGLRMSVAGAIFIVALIGIVLFDGLAETPAWASVLQAITESRMIRPVLLDLRGMGVDLMKLIRTIGLLATIGAASACYFALCWVMRLSAGGDVPLDRIVTTFAASLLPIAVAYHLAHYASYLALASQLIIPITSDPLGFGWNLFGTAGRVIDIGVITAEQVWWIALVSLVTGHALSVFVSHAEALRLFTSAKQAVRSQLPMMVFMVGLTSLSLWILAQPIVE